MKEAYRCLFEPIKINQLTLQNRVIAAPTSPFSIDKIACKAGLIVMGSGGINVKGAWWDTPYLFSKYEREKTRHTLNQLKAGGSRVSLELIHMGLYNRGAETVGPCDGVNDEGTRIRALTETELAELAEKFAEAALDAKQFGFDMVMLHFAHGWLPAQFLSPAWNKRTDHYGGVLENRMRFPLMILKQVRKAVGPDFPIDLRISAVEWIEEGITFAETKQFLTEAQKYVDMINLSAGTDMNKQGCIHMATTPFAPHNVNAHYARELKQTLAIPIAVVGGILEADDAAAILTKGQADLVTIGRALIADPKWLRKIMEGKEEDIVPCLRCSYCLHWTTDRINVGCSVNPRYLNEDLLPETIVPAAVSKKVVIIGGGISGMRSAITCAARGHQVILYEKEKDLGGVLRFCDHVEDKTELRRYRDYLIHQIKQLPITLKLGEMPSRESLLAMEPQALLIAVGAVSIIPRLEGKAYAIKALDAYEQIDSLSDKIVIIGGGSIGCELALTLAKKGRHVTILEAGNVLHRQDNRAYDLAIEEQLAKYKQSISIYKEVDCSEITAEGVWSKDGIFYEGQVILACGMKPNKEMAERYQGICADTYLLGDCRKVGKVKDTSADGTFLPYYL